jgi:hypothetical protein
VTDHLQDWLDSQSELQRKMPSPHPTDMFEAYTQEDQVLAEGNIKRAIDFIQWNGKALLHEMVELEGETGWKPWAKARFINLEAARGEWIDMFHFMANIALVLGLNDAEDIMRRYHAKHEKNATRQDEGYDGVSTTCQGCGRALDDVAVECGIRNGRLGAYEGPLNWCARLGRQFIPDLKHGGTDA